MVLTFTGGKLCKMHIDIQERSSLVVQQFKDLVLSLLWLGSQLRCAGFSPWALEILHAPSGAIKKKTSGRIEYPMDKFWEELYQGPVVAV